MGRCHVKTECIQTPPCGQLQPVSFPCSVPRSIAECVDDMVAYSKLNDSIIQLIKVHPNPDSNPNLKKAQDLIARLERRQLYTCIGETTPRVKSWFKVNMTANVHACVCVCVCVCV